MVVVRIEGGGGGGDAAPALMHYPATQYGEVFPPPAKFSSSSNGSSQGHNGFSDDSDAASDHSSSGRGSGGSDVGSDHDREGSRMQDSGRYSADGCESLLSNASQPKFSPMPIIEDDNSSYSQNRRAGPRTVAVTHGPVDAPLCGACQRKELQFFEPSCQGCSTLLRRPSTTAAHLFAIMRQWVPQVQHNIHAFIKQALSLGCHVDDRDALTDMTLLHYAVKSGSTGVGDPNNAIQVVRELLNRGADIHQRCRWTHMTALHYAAYFDVAPIMELLAGDPEGVSLEDPCLEYSGGAPLHIAAANLSLNATKVLLKHGASLTSTDTQGRTAFQCIPTSEQYEIVPDVQEVISQLRGLLSPHNAHNHNRSAMYANTGTISSSSSQGASGRAVLKAMGLRIGDRVLVSGVKTGTLRYVGTTEFATGLWAGVELETPTGKHNGAVKGVMYFRCANNFGVFVPFNRLTKIPNIGISSNRQGRSSSIARHQRSKSSSRRSISLPPGRVNHGRVDVSRVSSRVAQDIQNKARKIEIGDRVYVDMGIGTGETRTVLGVVRFTGSVHFASGFWIGVELDQPRGSNDGTVNGAHYFSCRNHHGIFAATSRVIKISSDHDIEGSLDAPGEPFSLGHKNRHYLHGSNHNMNSLGSLGYHSLNVSHNTNHHHGSSTGAPMSMSTSMADNCYSCTSAHHLLEGSGDNKNVRRAQSVKTAVYPSNTSMTSLNRSFSARYVSSRQRQEEHEKAVEEKKKEPQWTEPPVLPAPKNQKKKKENKHWLEIGHNVFYKSEVGVIKYIGKVHFESGLWLGVELRKAKGKHDGMVKGQRYYKCKTRHGVMVHPSSVTVRGINGALLVKPEHELEE